MSNYPDGLRSSYSTEAQYRCIPCDAADEDNLCFTVTGTVDLNQFEPDDEPCCPNCGSYHVEFQN